MSEAYNASVRLYWLAKKTEGPNREFNIESKRNAVHDDYHTCLKLLAAYSRTHPASIVAYSIWGGRKRLGVKFQGKNVTVGVVKSGDIKAGIANELKNVPDLPKYLENEMGFTIANLNEESFEKAYEQLRKIESENRMKIDPEEAKNWWRQTLTRRFVPEQ
jgi:hypothetical protein